MAYLTSKTTLTKPLLPYTDQRDNTFFKQLANGTRRVLSPEQFLGLVGYMESYRHYTGLKQQALSDLGGAAPALLAQGFLRHSALDTIPPC